MQDLAAKHIAPIKAVRQPQDRHDSGILGPCLNIIYLLSNLDDLINKHKLLLDSIKAGNTGIYNEIQPFVA